MRQWMVDAFASSAFRGNPACVVEPFDAWPEAGWMQALAQENNQAETAFLLRTADPARFGLRWFTPLLEVDLCGHATLGSAHVLFAELDLDAPEVAFDTRSGILTVQRSGQAYAMDFPADPPAPVEVPPGFSGALGVEVEEAFAAAYLIVVARDEAAVRTMARPGPDQIMAASKALTGGRGDLIVCARADAAAPYDVVSRFFAPGAGIPEDPATGSAHCMLSPLWSARLGRPRLKFHQAFPGRGGDLDCEHKGERVILRGQAVTVLEGRLRV